MHSLLEQAKHIGHKNNVFCRPLMADRATNWCLEAETLRGQHLQAVHKELQRVLWGPKADALWQDAAVLPALLVLLLHHAGRGGQAVRS